ncbi:hypothetical protein D3C87_1117440 [compost metagenome]
MQAALNAINQKHILLVFPIQNQKEPGSLWSELHPRTKMRWEWDANGDHKVSDLWILREQLSRSNKVIYTKWYQNRATFFSQEAFINMLAFMRTEQPMTRESREILDALEMDSPLSTKQIKEVSGLQGRLLESTYNRAMKALWQRLLIVAYGEVDDSSFPSLAVGASKNIFEELFLQAQDIDPKEAEKFLAKALGADNKFWLFALKIKKSLS